MTEEIRLPAIHITHDHEEDGRLVRDVITSPVCDFCMDVGPTWEYDCADFTLGEGVMLGAGGKGWGSQGPWLACETCADYIERRHRQRLAGRAASSKQGTGTGPRVAAIEAWLVVNGFFDHMTGERKPFG